MSHQSATPNPSVINALSRWLVPLLLLLPSVLFAADKAQPVAVASPAPGQELSIERLSARIAGLEAIAEPDQETKSTLDAYRSALSMLKTAHEDRSAADRYKNTVDNAKQLLARLETQLANARAKARRPSRPDSTLSAEGLEQQLDKALAEQEIIEGGLAGLESEARKERLRPDQIRSELSQAKLELEEAETRLRSAESSDAPLSETQRITLMASRTALSSRIKRLEMERLSHSPRQSLLSSQIELAQVQIAYSSALVQQLQDRLNELHAEQANIVRAETAKAAEETLGKHPILRREAEYNAALSTRLSTLAAGIKQAVRDKEQVLAEHKQIAKMRKRAQQQVEIVGLDESLGELLVTHSRRLPDTKSLNRKINENRQKISRSRVETFRWEDEQQQLSSEEEIGKRIEQLQPADLPAEQKLANGAVLRALFDDRKELLKTLVEEQTRYEEGLGDLSLEQRQLLNEITQYRDFLNRNLIWIPSAGSLQLSDLTALGTALGWLFSGENWLAAAKQFALGILNHPVKSTLLLVVVSTLLLTRTRMRTRLEEMVGKVGKVPQDRFVFSTEALLYTLLLALPPVLGLAAGGWLLSQGDAPSFARVLGRGALDISILFFVLRFSHYLLAPTGLARTHLRWDPLAVKVLFRSLRWLTPLLIPIAFLVGITEWKLDENFRGSLGRIANLLMVILLLIMSHLSFNPRNGALSRSRHKILQGWRLRAFWYPLALALPVVLFMLIVNGYYYSAVRLERLIFNSFCIGVVILLLHGFARRWLLISQRRLALQRALAKRQAAQEAKAAKEAAEAAGEGLPDAEEMEAINLATLNEQARRLLRVTGIVVFFMALFFLWSEMTPALGWLDEIVLWQQSTGGSENPQLLPVSLWDLALSLLVIILILVAGRNLPGLLEIALLQPLELQPGNRYAISKFSEYLIYGGGALIALKTVGVGWSDIQWLVAAMGVGLGFGLKEIFSNFFSGLIMLIERPIRIGDTVTIGDLSGIVTRMRIRATTITDWDNKEQVIPNQNFIIGPFINWTLSDPITRVVIPVGVAYGTDTEKALRVITEVVESHSEVLEEPRPTIFFIEFGESSLNFEIRVFVKDRLRRLPLTHDLHMMLDKALREAGIEIPFPQRDLHLRSMDSGITLKNGDLRETD
jgi:potassium efflux system protein